MAMLRVIDFSSVRSFCSNWFHLGYSQFKITLAMICFVVLVSPTLTASNCHEVLERFAGARVAKEFSDSPRALVLDASGESVILGSSSGILYRKELRIMEGHRSIPFYFDFSYLPESFLGAMRVPRVLMFPALERSSPHILRLKLNRDLGDGLEDLGLFEDSLRYLYHRSDRELDEFHFAISEPSLIRRMNQALVGKLKSSGWNAGEPRLIIEKNREIPDCRVACFEDSLWVGMGRGEFIERLSSTDHETLQAELVREAERSPLFQMVTNSGLWDVAITIQSIDVQMESEGFTQSAVIYKFIGVLKPAW